ncbi:MAG: hypothetical protein OEL77_04820 [Nitrosopumilus sp.]|nr:hypothetical protein [Nitrosopumilus sp.]MDH3385319.1 hypothetical protein [Nitrosopumilus sp.]
MFIILKKTIGTTAKVVEDYGGYEITVTDKEKFPWFDVFLLLLDSGFQIWIDKKNSHIQIMSKPEVN